MTSGAPSTILNVDDTEVARYTKHRTLSHAGFKVVDAVSGGQALELIDSLHPDLVLLDVRLPDINGIEVCRIIKARWPSTVVLHPASESCAWHAWRWRRGSSHSSAQETAMARAAQVR